MIQITYLIILSLIFFVFFRSINDFIKHRKLMKKYKLYADFKSFAIDLINDIN